MIIEEKVRAKERHQRHTVICEVPDAGSTMTTPSIDTVITTEKAVTHPEFTNKTTSHATNECDSLKLKLEQLLLSLEAEGKNIVASVIADSLGARLPTITELLRGMGFNQTTEIDPTTHMCIWNRAEGKRNSLNEERHQADEWLMEKEEHFSKVASGLINKGSEASKACSL